MPSDLYFGAVRVRDGKGLFRKETEMFNGETFWAFMRQLEVASQEPGRRVIVIIDNAKCAIIKACVREPTVQRAYAECAEGYGFKIDPCPPRDPQKKGIVEAGVKYIKGSFLPLREFRDLEDANRQLQGGNERGRQPDPRHDSRSTAQALCRSRKRSAHGVTCRAAGIGKLVRGYRPS